jgi:CBS domain-containing protein
MPAILPIVVSLADESKVRLVYEGGRLQNMPVPLAPQSRRRPAAKLLLHHHEEFVPRCEIASAPGVEQARYVAIGTSQMVLRIPPS